MEEGEEMSEEYLIQCPNCDSWEVKLYEDYKGRNKFFCVSCNYKDYVENATKHYRGESLP